MLFHRFSFYRLSYEDPETGSYYPQTGKTQKPDVVPALTYNSGFQPIHFPGIDEQTMKRIEPMSRRRRCGECPAERPLNRRHRLRHVHKEPTAMEGKTTDPESIAAFRENLGNKRRLNRFVLPHDSYPINLAHPEAEGLKKSRMPFLTR